MKKLLLIDCYDSFTDILAQNLTEAGNCQVKIQPWDNLNFDDFKKFAGIVLSPGPGLPEDYPLIFDALDLLKDKPVLGVCMGHQILGLKCGANLKHLPQVFHGLQTKLNICQKDSIFNGIENGTPLGLYHSWVLDNLPDDMQLLAKSAENRIMLIKHARYPWYGFQFHPESYMTIQGKRLLSNWVLAISN